MEFRKDNMSEYCKNCYELQEQLDQLKAENKHINDLLNQALKELEKTRETLTEIKEIAEPFCNACQEFEPEKRSSNCMYCNYGKILQKISECKVKNEYNTKDIRHINENNQEYIAEGNRMTKNEKRTKGTINEKIEYDIKSDMIAQEEKKKIKRSECPYGGIDCAWCGEDCE